MVLVYIHWKLLVDIYEVVVILVRVYFKEKNIYYITHHRMEMIPHLCTLKRNV